MINFKSKPFKLQSGRIIKKAKGLHVGRVYNNSKNCYVYAHLGSLGRCEGVQLLHLANKSKHDILENHLHELEVAWLEAFNLLINNYFPDD